MPNIPLSLPLIILTLFNCMSLQVYELKINKNIKTEKPKSISILINNQTPNLNDETQKLFINTFQSIFEKEDIKINFNKEKKPNEISINLYWIFDNNYKVRTDTYYLEGKMFATTLNIPNIKAEFRAYQYGDDDPIFGIYKSFIGNYERTKDNLYLVEKNKAVAIRIAKFYANIIANIYKKPVEMPGKWNKLFQGETYIFTETDKTYMGKYESPIYESYSKRKSQSVDIISVSKDYTERGMQKIHNGTRSSIDIDLDTKKNSESRREIELHIFGNMLVIYIFYPKHIEGDDLYFVEYFIKEE